MSGRVHRALVAGAGFTRARFFGAGVLGALVLGACARDLPGEDPPADAFYFPIGLDLHDPSSASASPTVYVVSSNFDLRFNTGWLSVIDVDDLLDRLEAGCGACSFGEVCVDLAGEAQCRDEHLPDACAETCLDHQRCAEGASGPQCLDRPDLTGSIVQQLRVPSLAGQIGVAPDGDVALVVARGGAPFTRIEMSEGRELHCGDPEATEGLTTGLQRTDCDRDHLTELVVERSTDAEGEPLPDDPTLLPVEAVAEDRTFSLEQSASEAVSREEILDPFAVKVFELDDPDDPAPWAAVGYLTAGFISMFRVAVDEPLRHERAIGRLLTGVGGFAIHPGSSSRHLLATSQRKVTDQDNATVYDVELGMGFEQIDLAEEPLEAPFRSVSMSDPLGGFEMLDLVLGPSAGGVNRAYAAVRRPDMVAVLDVGLTTGFVTNALGERVAVEQPRLAPLGGLSIPGRPSGLVFVDRAGTDLVVAAAFDDDALFVLSVLGDGLHLERRIDRVGAGPFQVRHVLHRGRHLVFVSMFFEHAVAVVDVTAEDANAIEVVGQIRSRVLESSDERDRR